ncbi:MAG: branched-chain amino acid ABC transporter substrate-binding protein [Gemmatimonas sp.]
MKKIIPIVVVIAVAIAAWALLMPKGADRGSNASKDIVIAVAGPMTGQYSAFGEQMRRGAERAVADINAKGGINGHKLRLEVGDDSCDPKQAVSIANQFASRGVVFVAGHYCSSTSIPASDVYQQEGLVQVSPASTNPALTERGLSNIFRLCGRDDQQGPAAAEFIAKQFPGKRIAIVHDNQAYSKGLADQTKRRLNELGITEALYDTVTPGERDYSAIVTKLKAAQIDILYYGGYHSEAGLIVRQMREQGMDTRLIAGDALVTQEYWSITGPAGNGTMMSFSPDPRKNPEAADVVKGFRDAGYEPEGYTLYTYATVQVFAQAAGDGSNVTAPSLVSALRSGKFQTVLGPLSFDAKGDVQAPGYVFYEWRDGKYAEVEG